jgi:type IV pilus assembly protein PilX
MSGRRLGAAGRRQEGVALLVALVVLVIIALTSASVMRGALSTDLVANNSRVQALAMQAAQIGLRYCEGEAGGPTPTITVLPQNPLNVWSTYSNWNVANNVNEVPASYMKSENGTFWPDKLPQCMAQELKVGTKVAYQVTARGFSPDYSDDDDGFTETGSVVWLQSIVYLK